MNALLKELLEERGLPPILAMNDGTPVTPLTWPAKRREMLDALTSYSYGRTPPPPARVWGETLAENREFTDTCAGKVRQERIRLSIETERGIFSFPFVLSVPKRPQKPPVFLNLAFRHDLPDRYVPLEEITDGGYAVATVCYTDIVNDAHFGDFSDGLAAYFGTNGGRAPDEWGKIGMWAYGASRILDCLLTRDDIDALHTAVIGHSRLGKTALWTAAQDERFFAAISNDSGYGGAATSRHGEGERVRDFLRAGSWDWFCENFQAFTDAREDSKPYDQAFLLALIAPRLLCVGSAEEDRGADPKSEFLTALWASQAWEMLGVPGLKTPDRLPAAGDILFGGNVGYQLRAGTHFLSREDWNRYMLFLDEKLGR